LSLVFTGKYWTIQRFVSGFANNAFLITCTRTNHAVIIDTPAEPVELVLAALKTTVGAILITHGHRDHVEGYGFVADSIQPADGVGIGTYDRNSLPSSAPSTLDVATNQIFSTGDISLRAMATPGHTSGSTCYVLATPESSAAGEPAHVFTGDTLFPGGPGKSSSHTALKQILESLESNIFTLPEQTSVLPGHGEFTTIGESKREYSAFAARPLDPELMGDVTWA